MAEVIGAHLHLETVAGTPQGQEHHSGVVEQEIEACVALTETGGAGADRGEVGQVEIGQLQACLGILVEDRPPRPLRLFAIAAGHHHGRPFAGQRARRLPTQAAVGAGDQRQAPGQLWNVASCPGMHRSFSA